MTTPASSTTSDDLRRWAAEQLGFSREAARQPSRGPLLARAGQGGFCSDQRMGRAGAVLLNDANRGRLGAQDAVQTGWREALQQQVERFAAGFFTLPPEARRQHWQALNVEVPGSAAAGARLTALERGLSVKPEELRIAGADEAEFGNLLATSFVRPPYERAINAASNSRNCRQERQRWENAGPLAAAL